MMHGFDYPWWSQWSDAQPGWTASLAPTSSAPGSPSRTSTCCSRASCPPGLFAVADGRRRSGPLPASTRAPRPRRRLPPAPDLPGRRGAGRRCAARRAAGRCAACSTVRASTSAGSSACRADAARPPRASSRLYAPLARWADDRAREAVSEATAHGLAAGPPRRAAAGPASVHMVSSYARVDHRPGGALQRGPRPPLRARLRALALPAAHLRPYPVRWPSSACAVLALWRVLDGPGDHRVQHPDRDPALAQGLVLARIALRLALAGAVPDLYRRHAVAGGVPCRAA